MLRYAIQVGLLAAVAILAWRRGGQPERQAATVLVAMLLINAAYLVFDGGADYVDVGTFHVFNDGWALAAILAIALTADRFWTLWLAALQVIAALAHFVRMADVTVHPMVYAIMIRAPYWCQIGVLAWGTWNFDRRRKAEFSTLQTSLRV